MARVAVNADLVADLLFGYSDFPVAIRGARFAEIRGEVLFEIDGPDVPEADEVKAEFTVQQNRRGEKFHSLKFKPVG